MIMSPSICEWIDLHFFRLRRDHNCFSTDPDHGNFHLTEFSETVSFNPHPLAKRPHVSQGLDLQMGTFQAQILGDVVALSTNNVEGRRPIEAHHKIHNWKTGKALYVSS